MAQPGIPDDVAAFLNRNVRSVELLEILLLLHSDPKRDWTADQVCAQQYSNAA